ncbi:hypothetical protein K8I85_11720, partial [bacterium]|nr:hypothetical protein [bacterium]
VPIDTLGEPGPVLRAVPEAEDAIGTRPDSRGGAAVCGSHHGWSTAISSARTSVAADPVAPGRGVDMPTGTLGVTEDRKDDAPRVTDPVLREEIMDTDADAGADAAVPDRKGEAPAPPPAEARTTTPETARQERPEEPEPERKAAPERAPEEKPEANRKTPPPSSAVTPRPEPSRSRQESDAEPRDSAWGSSRSLYRPSPDAALILPEGGDVVPVRGEREWERDLAQLARAALATDDPEATLTLAREWDRFHAVYPDREDVLRDRAAAWVRAARLGAKGACDEAPARIDDCREAARDDAEWGAAQVLRDELSTVCP